MRTFPAISFFILLTFIASAQEASEATKTEQMPIQFQVVKGWRVDLGDRSIFLNRVVPPVFSAGPAMIHAENPQTSEATLTNIMAAKKKFEILFLSAIVYDRKVTEIRWMDNVHAWTAFSNVDFNLLGGAATFETADTVYSLLLAVVNENTGENGALDLSAANDRSLTRKAKQIPSLDNFSPTQAQYLVAEDANGGFPQVKDLAAMDAIHVYFDANRQRLADEFGKREVARIEQEQRPKEPPPKPKNTVINYWKIDAAPVQVTNGGKGK